MCETVCIFDCWQPHLCNSQANEMRDLLSFGKEIKKYFQNRVIVIL